MKWISGLLLGTVLCSPSISPADVYYHSSTADEGYLRGWGDYQRSCGEYLQGLGEYVIDCQTAYSQAIGNWAGRIRTKWAIQDEYRARNRRPNYLDLQERYLDMAERRYVLRQRERDLIGNGILPPKPEPSITINGHKYKSFQEYKQLRDAKLTKEIVQ